MDSFLPRTYQNTQRKTVSSISTNSIIWIISTSTWNNPLLVESKCQELWDLVSSKVQNKASQSTKISGMWLHLAINSIQLQQKRRKDRTEEKGETTWRHRVTSRVSWASGATVLLGGGGWFLKRHQLSSPWQRPRRLQQHSHEDRGGAGGRDCGCQAPLTRGVWGNVPRGPLVQDAVICRRRLQPWGPAWFRAPLLPTLRFLCSVVWSPIPWPPDPETHRRAFYLLL